MKVEEVQAFVRQVRSSSWLGWSGDTKWSLASTPIAEVVLLPNCTDEVDDAIKARLADGAEVRSLRLRHFEAAHIVALTECEHALARALDMPEGRPFAEYVEAVSALMRRTRDDGRSIACLHDTIRTQRDGLAQALGMSGFTMIDLVKAAREARECANRCEMSECRQKGAVSTQEYENVRADNERLRDRVAALEAEAAKGGAWIEKRQAEAYYNKGCADTVAAFRKAQGDA